MLKAIKVVLTTRQHIASRVGRKLESGESISHFLYGAAIIMEHHWELSFYSVSALALGVFAILTVIFFHGESGA